MATISDSSHSMRQVRVNHDKNFTTVSNEFIRDNKLSLKGKGLLLTILSLNDEEWDFSINGMCSILKESKTAVYNAIDELIELGYCEREQYRDEISGRMLPMIYTFYEHPIDSVQNPCTENQEAEDADADFVPQLNTIIKEIPKEKKTKEEKPSKKKGFDFLAALLAIGIEEQIAKDWMKIRTSKKASDSETAFKQLHTALETIKSTHNVSFNEAISICVTNGWYGCKPSYFDNIRLDDYGFGTQTSLFQQNNGKEWQ